jgi:predicted metal-dependent hydrolase
MKRVSVRDQSSRWGSCSTTGVLSYSWRLIFTPPFVLDNLAAHEIAHRRGESLAPLYLGLRHAGMFWRHQLSLPA